MCRVMAILAFSGGIWSLPGALLWHYGGAQVECGGNVMICLGYMMEVSCQF